MERCDVIIIGGGPAGSSCARALRESGLDVLIVDKKAFPRDKTCAGWVTPAVLQLLKFDADEYRQGRTLQPITAFRTGMINGEAVLTSYGEPVSFGIRRCEFDHYLLLKSGARTRLNESVRSLERVDGLWVVNESVAAPLLVGAGGHFCPVARHLGSRDLSGSSVVTAQEIEFAAEPEQFSRVQVRPEVPELYFCRDLKGYGWCFRKGDFLNIGLGRTDNHNLSTHVNEFVEFLASTRRVECDIPERFHGHAYQLYERVQPKLVDDGVLLIGDAAGLAYAQSGEGIRPAVESGFMAAETIIGCRGDYCAANLEGYRRQILTRFGTPRERSTAAFLPEACLRFLAAGLISSRWFARHIVLNRWFLHASQPALAR